MSSYLNFKSSRVNYSVSHSFNLIFKKVETLLFSFLCVICLTVSKVDRDFSRNVSFAFVDVSLPVVKFAAFPFNVVIDLLTNFGELVEAKRENKALKEELEKLKSFYIQSLNIHQENKELRKILNFVAAKSSSFKVARIIGHSHRLFSQKVFIDAGKNRGLKEGMIVAGKYGIIGRISEVAADKSRLILLNDAASKIPVITSKSRVRGILVGNGGNLMSIFYLPKNHKIEIGDTVFTSGDGDTLPPGLLVGVVKKVVKDAIFVAMVEDVDNADIVTVME
ncbi:MAG: rod shape-determining protein MreC [Alphaproteobacteria bacterium RIFCSPLOWO2_01_FULL_40_26]|nr:MAG: rod shape-determining protein MreC [Alphaproteobacteria bacterium RIFCSPHIGHO2_02_FULL_40_34]OFW87101.1 MAG: rod shape-determining protein MreC [Alphaproteobacteria bacterium RIFCSPHIGHO2_01_FULL_40_8]OFW94675.1 MAG: rod shape-determining protein MreC [Alphaproteobacteria bacterium RIFCSPLOWO2_01_FULL_40_26]OFX10143.1 MAG: rod shape-determining protein MreC [Alphaproteobacteria bacterium RIFCSPLOWO2_02_FULL_40_19]OFX11772.1 MAG: rod shape-determining protein MreC [Alphaproteobacteria ba